MPVGEIKWKKEEKKKKKNISAFPGTEQKKKSGQDT